jgi:hypothetical protein
MEARARKAASLPLLLVCMVCLPSLISSQQRGAAPPKVATVPAGLNVRGTLTADSIIGAGVAMTSTTAQASLLTANALNVKDISVLDTEAKTITSPTGSIKVEGHLQVAGSIVYKDTTESLKTLPADPFKTSLLEVNEGPLVPWRLVQMEVFSASSGAEWLHKELNNKNIKQSSGSITHCGDKNFMLGGHCSPNGGGGESSRSFVKLPSHSMVRVTARFHFIDSWDGESAYAKIDDEVVWLDSHNSATKTNGVSLCGSKHPDSKMGSLIDVSFPHTTSSVRLTFGATLDGDSCEESWAVDDIAVYVR